MFNGDPRFKPLPPFFAVETNMEKHHWRQELEREHDKASYDTKGTLQIPWDDNGPVDDQEHQP